LSTLEAWIATYPGANQKYLAETIESLRAQGIEPHVQNDERLPHEKWNEAIECCTSDYLALPHHDDVYTPAWSKELTAYLDAHPDVVAVFCLDYLINEDGVRTGQTKGDWEPKDTYNFKDIFGLILSHGTPLRCETVIFNRKVLGDLRYPDRTVSGTAQDTQFWYEIADKHPIGIVMKPLVKYRVHPASDTQTSVIRNGKVLDGWNARIYGSKIRPQDVEFNHVIALFSKYKEIEDAQESERLRIQSQTGGCEFLVCHEPPDNAGTGVVVAHRVRTLNRCGDGITLYYVFPVDGADIDIR